MRRHVITFACCGALLALALPGAGCGRAEGTGGAADFSERPVRAVATTTLMADLVQAVGGEHVDVTGLMGAGVDPHLYRAKESDVAAMAEADILFYNGLHLEGKMTELFEQMSGRALRTVAVAERAVPEAERISSAAFAGNFDPHVWFDVALWMRAVETVRDALADLDPAHADAYAANAAAYVDELRDLDAYVRTRIAEVPDGQRVLVTAHDAFSYFGRAYGFEVRGLQGLSTATEAGTADVQRLAAFIAERRIPAIFVESSVSPRSIEAVQAAVRARGFDVAIGGNLYSDALGSPGTPAETYPGTVRHNVDTIVDALKGSPL